MIKKFFVFIVILLIVACHYHIHSSTLSFNQQVEQNNDTILIGRGSLSILQTGSYKYWYNAFYKNYIVDSITTEQLKPLFKGKTIEIFLGSWCSDSRREVPRMIKVLSYTGFDTAHVQFIFVDHAKKSPQHEEQGKHITNVPTFIVYNGKKEIGRIVESPQVSLEKDLLSILQLYQ